MFEGCAAALVIELSVELGSSLSGRASRAAAAVARKRFLRELSVSMGGEGLVPSTCTSGARDSHLLKRTGFVSAVSRPKLRPAANGRLQGPLECSRLGPGAAAWRAKRVVFSNTLASPQAD